MRVSPSGSIHSALKRRADALRQGSEGDDLKTIKVKSFLSVVKPKRGETLVSSSYKSRAHRDS